MAKPQPDFSMDDVQKEMARVVEEMYNNLGPPRNGDPGLSTQEYAELWKISYPAARRRLAILEEKGLIIAGSKHIRRKGDGRWFQIPVYRPKKEEKEVVHG